MARVCLVSCVFPPEPVVSAKTSSTIARGLVERGHSVEVLAPFPNRPQGRLFEGYRRGFFLREMAPDGYPIRRLFSTTSPHSTLISRWLENLTFGISSGFILMFSKCPDVVYSNTWPIISTGIISLVCKFRSIPIIIHVKDMYPESLSVQGRVRSEHWSYRLLLKFDKWIVNQAAALIVLSESFALGYAQTRGIDPSTLHVIPDWIEAGQVEVQEKEAYRKKVGISSDAFVIAYGGNIGTAAGVETVIEAMERVRSDREIVLVVAGSGSRVEACRQLAEQIHNVRVVFHSPWAAEDTAQVLGSADVLLLPTRGKQSLASIPSKLLSYLLASRPVLAAVMEESDTAYVIEKGNCGWITEPDNPEKFARKVEELIEVKTEILEKMGRAGREYVLANFSSDKCVPRVIEVIECAAQKKI